MKIYFTDFLLYFIKNWWKICIELGWENYGFFTEIMTWKKNLDFELNLIKIDVELSQIVWEQALRVEEYNVAQKQV